MSYTNEKIYGNVKCKYEKNVKKFTNKNNQLQSGCKEAKRTEKFIIHKTNSEIIKKVNIFFMRNILIRYPRRYPDTGTISHCFFFR